MAKKPRTKRRPIRIIPANPGPDRETIIRLRNEWTPLKRKMTKQLAIQLLGGTIDAHDAT